MNKEDLIEKYTDHIKTFDVLWCDCTDPHRRNVLADRMATLEMVIEDLEEIDK